MRLFFLFFSFSVFISCSQKVSHSTLSDLSGEWRFAMDSADSGISEKWFTSALEERVSLPGSTTSNDQGLDVDLQTNWTGSIFDSSYFTDESYAKYRETGNIKVPFWLQPVKYYVGPAWYQKEIVIPEDSFEHGAQLFIERCHWESMVWLDSILLGTENSLSTPHEYYYRTRLTPGKHLLTVRIDNRVKDIDVGQNSHSISDHTQTNWNGMIGEISLKPIQSVIVESVRLFPDVENKRVDIQAVVEHISGETNAEITFFVKTAEGGKLAKVVQQIDLEPGKNKLTFTYAMGDDIQLWDEHNPAVYQMVTAVSVGDRTIEREDSFGMRKVVVRGTDILLNDKPIFLRGTLESGIFPLTGFPPTDVESWSAIMQKCKDYGLNHLRFHSWCPPRAAFVAADRLGMYLQIECGTWANQGATVGDGKPLDAYILRESERIVESYGNHPSFLMMAYGNEPAGQNHVAFLTKFVVDWKEKDDRRLYTTAAGWPAVAENDFNNIPEPRIQSWGEGLKSIINSQKPRSDYEWSDKIAKYPIPTVSHEIGQWCVYPDFKEIDSYTGVLKAKNFEIFKERLESNGMGDLAEQFLLASGKLQTLCYKADIEAALRTPGFGGFQLLDLHDFPGQGTALVGVLNPFWEEKGYVDAKTYRQFCNSTVPLARFPKFVYTNNTALSVPIEIAHFGPEPITDAEVKWKVVNGAGKEYGAGKFTLPVLSLGNSQKAGVVNMALSTIKKAEKMQLSVQVDSFENHWDFYVYPHDSVLGTSSIYVTDHFNVKAKEVLSEGGTVLYSLKQGTLREEMGGKVALGFSSIFWNSAWTGGQPPETLGILCDPEHPALAEFPTDYHSNWQWWDPITHANAMLLDKINPAIEPIVRVIDDWVTARPLGLVFEARVGNGKIIVSSIDLLSDIEKRPEAKQLQRSLESYAGSDDFNPKLELTLADIMKLEK